MLLYKAVSEQGNEFFSLGMGPAKIIPLPRNIEIDGGKFGISACTTIGTAMQIIRDAKRRQRLPIPPNMRVVAVEGNIREIHKYQRVTCNSIHIIGGKGDDA